MCFETEILGAQAGTNQVLAASAATLAAVWVGAVLTRKREHGAWLRARRADLYMRVGHESYVFGHHLAAGSSDTRDPRRELEVVEAMLEGALSLAGLLFETEVISSEPVRQASVALHRAVDELGQERDQPADRRKELRSAFDGTLVAFAEAARREIGGDK